MVEIPTIAIFVIVVSVVGLVGGILALALWLVAVIPVMGAITSAYTLTFPIFALLASPFVLLGGGPFLMAWSSFKFTVFMLEMGVLNTMD